MSNCSRIKIRQYWCRANHSRQNKSWSSPSDCARPGPCRRGVLEGSSIFTAFGIRYWPCLLMLSFSRRRSFCEVTGENKNILVSPQQGIKHLYTSILWLGSMWLGHGCCHCPACFRKQNKTKKNIPGTYLANLESSVVGLVSCQVLSFSLTTHFVSQAILSHMTKHTKRTKYTLTR